MLKKLLHAVMALVLTSGLALAAFNLGFDGRFMPQGSGTAPALTSCGTSPAISGTDVAGTVTLGTGTPTGCIITFNVAYVGVPYCVVTSQTAPATTTPAYSVLAASITIVQAANSSNKYDYFCAARTGG